MVTLLNMEYESILELSGVREDETYRLYRDVLRLLLIDAVRTLYGAAPLYVRQSVGHATYFELHCDGVSAHALEAEMRRRVAENVVFRLKRVPREEARDALAAQGEQALSEEVASLPCSHLYLCRLGEQYRVIYTEMPSCVLRSPLFAIEPYEDGFLLRYPNAQTDVIEPSQNLKIHDAINDYRAWSSIIRAGDVYALNRRLEEGAASDVVNLSEGLHERNVIAVADRVLRGGVRMVLIAGPSASGKTSFANRLCIQLRINTLEPVVLSMDNYFLSHDEIPADENGERDFDAVSALDGALFNEQVGALIRGESVQVPIFDFLNSCRSAETRRLQLQENQVLIVEGIHALNDLLTTSVPKPQKFKVYCSALTGTCFDDWNTVSPTDVRFLRRVVRDHAFRGASAEYTFRLWGNVRRGERVNIFPYENSADVIFNSALAYELAALKLPAEAVLREVGADSPFYTRARRLLMLLDHVRPMDTATIPPTSIVREFIGGSTIV